MQTDKYPLPFGWIKEFDQPTGRSFYVDTKATPPRSIWTHPYEDNEYLKAHPEVREKLDTNRFGGSDSNLPPPSFEESQRRHSFDGGKPSSSSQPQDTSAPVPGSSKSRGPIGALKVQLFGTKEEREEQKKKKKAEKQARKEADRQYWQQMHAARQQYYASQAQCGYGGQGYGAPGYGPQGYGPQGYGNPYYNDGFGPQQRRRGGGGGLALPLIGGLAGGLLLGEVLDDFGGGGFDGGFDGGFF